MSLKELSCAKFFDGLQYKYQHFSKTNNWPMKFSVYLPPKALIGEKCAAMIWLTGRTLGEFGFTNKSGFQRFASKYGMIVFAPEPTPRGIEEPLADGSFEYGAQLGGYVDAITPKWRDHYQMYSYIVKEFYNLAINQFPVSPEKICLSGHSMGGTASISLGLRHVDMFASVTSMSGNYNLTNTEDGKKMYELYLGDNKEIWKLYDPTEVARRYSGPARKFLIDMGGGDMVYEGTYQSALLDACRQQNISLIYRVHSKYHHAYEFIQTFVEDHFKFHLQTLDVL